ncbi:MAG: formylglycine-generating enzyme family protein [Haliscomenobacter sp.]|uniref:formylglycine-generating enzyme family protein n=1 Tax=Haliscomenobacter sp. TaxID=2717303 RepID=UPI0029A9EF88|nr:formylglycine-generating enzyme family protein [Haliscomenobacter sp.]MDX2072578.1 formylglycine-generating enzyme family protein [Haliscomenobacter sp.]
MTELPFTHIIPGMDSSELVLVEGGTLIMGGYEYPEEYPIHEVTVPSFVIGKFPVTQELWMAMMGENPSYFIDPKRPVEQVSWKDTRALFQKVNHDPRLSRGQFFRLPTEAEWEFAARGGKKSDGFYYVGGDKLDEVGWYKDNSYDETKQVGLKLANELGLHDLSGNVMEWCVDQWHADYWGAPTDGSAWVDKDESASRVLRGGSWDYSPQYCRPSYRSYVHPSTRYNLVGFRVVLGSPPGS